MRSMPDAVILCGGAGLRLRPITGDAPKSMAAVAGRPFLEVLIGQLRRHGFERAILAVGYQAETIQGHFKEQAFGVQLAYSEESSPLGTGGALKHAAGHLVSDDVLVMNGDSFADADLAALVAHHRASRADVSLVVVPADGRGDCGNVSVNDAGLVTAFEEKRNGQNARYVNAGIYMVSRHILDAIPAGVQLSLEKELFGRWIAEGRQIRALIHPGTCIDIGTPERYQKAQEILFGVEVGTTTRRESAF